MSIGRILIIMNKADLRRQMTKQRIRLNDTETVDKSRRIITQLLTEIDWQSIGSMHVYQSKQSWNEVRTDELVKYIKTHYPNVQLVVGESDKSATMPMKQFDCVVVPLVAFDDHRRRLGLGGGWYDRFLTLQTNAILIGLGYEFQRVDELPNESHDIPLSKVITEANIY